MATVPIGNYILICIALILMYFAFLVNVIQSARFKKRVKSFLNKNNKLENFNAFVEESKKFDKN